MIEHDREFGTSGLWQHLQQKRFVVHNAEWLHMAETTAWHPSMANGGAGGGGAGGGAGALGHGYDGNDDALLARRHGGGGGAGEGPDAYVAEDDYEAEPPAADEDARSPLHHMGKHGEAVAFDVSYLFHQQALAGGAGANGMGGGGTMGMGGVGGIGMGGMGSSSSSAAMRPLVSDRPGLGAPYDYAEDVDTDGEGGDGQDDGDDRGAGRRGNDDDEEEDGEGEEIGDDVRALMDQFMHAAPGNGGVIGGGGMGASGGGGGMGARGMLANNAAMKPGGVGASGLVGGAMQVRPHALGPRTGVGAGMSLSGGGRSGLDAWETGED